MFHVKRLFMKYILFSLLLLSPLFGKAQSMEAGVFTGCISFNNSAQASIYTINPGSYWTNGLYLRKSGKHYALSIAYSLCSYRSNYVYPEVYIWDAYPEISEKDSYEILKNIHQIRISIDRMLFSKSRISILGGANASFTLLRNYVDNYIDAYGANHLFLGTYNYKYTLNTEFIGAGISQSVNYKLNKHLTASFTALQCYNYSLDYSTYSKLQFSFLTGLGYKF